MSSAGTLVLLNGTSSSGKSTILKAFQKRHADFTFFQIDDWHPAEMADKAKLLGWQEDSSEHPSVFLTKYVEEKTGRPNFESEVRAYLYRDIPPMYTAVKEALESGSHVVMDTVFEYDPEYQKFSDFFDAFAPIKVLVYCRLDVLLERVHKRNNSGNPADIRTAFQSFEQFPAIYKLQEHPHEIVVDRVSANSMRIALETAIQDLVDNHIDEQFLPVLEFFKLDFIKRFELGTRDEINLVPRHAYDLVLDSSFTTPEELGRAIETAIGRHP